MKLLSAVITGIALAAWGIGAYANSVIVGVILFVVAAAAFIAASRKNG